jgi:hypothetical protein
VELQFRPSLSLFITSRRSLLDKGHGTKKVEVETHRHKAGGVPFCLGRF